MLHARKDYAHIQDPSGKIPAKEPVILFRAQDKHTPAVVQFYIRLCKIEGTEKTLEIAEVLTEHLRKIEAWPVKKTPDL